MSSRRVRSAGSSASKTVWCVTTGQAVHSRQRMQSTERSFCQMLMSIGQFSRQRSQRVQQPWSTRIW